MLLDINISKLSKLIQSFYELTKIRLVIYDDALRIVFAYPEQISSFCEMMNQHPVTQQKCYESAKILCEKCKKEKRLVSHTCHAGLTDVVAPLYENDVVIGYIMFGQITNIENRKLFVEQATSLCKDYPLYSEELYNSLLLIPYKSDTQIAAVSEIVNTFTAYLYFEHIVSLKKEDTLTMILHYISQNLESNLSVDAICDAFSMPKSSLYKMTESSMPNGIAKYIKHKRIEKAKELLADTKLSVEEISGRVGFWDSDYFRRVFKQFTGLSASVYRKQHNNKP